MIKLDATRSTNATLKELWQNDHAVDWTVLWAMDQTEGRGQQGTKWFSEPGKNLTFSVLKTFSGLEVRHQFLLNMAVSLAVHNAMAVLKIPDLRVKWPNDIMSGSDKICGILIENIVKSSAIHAAILGIGLNINQQDFGEIQGAGSLKTVTGSEFDLNLVLNGIIDTLKERLELLNSNAFQRVKAEYEQVLYKSGERASFKMPDGTTESGYIRGISEQGKLLVEINGSVADFGMKEIQLLVQ